MNKPIPDEAQRIGVAMALGSDPVRGLLALYRLHLGGTQVDRLFCPKGATLTAQPQAVPSDVPF